MYREAIRNVRGTQETGAVAVVHGGRGEPLGVGLFDASSPLAVRIFDRDTRVRLDERAIVARAAHAFEARRRLLFGGSAPPDTNAYRLVNGEGDRVPGLVIDRYDSVAVARSDGAAMAAWIDRLAKPLFSALEPLGVRSLLARVDSEANAKKTRALCGVAAPDVVDVRENGMVMEVDLAFGQKTGAFLDQRDNRRRVRELTAPGSRVLNLFSYTGGFSLAAALGGAAEVTSVDSASRAHATAQRSFRKNGIDPGRHSFVTADAFSFLDEAAKRGRRFDLVVCDPPSFAPNEKSKKKALGAYQKLHRACAAVLAPGGVLCAASCSSHVTMEELLSTLDDVALGRGDLSLHGAFGPPPDHPSPAAFPEGRYLKFCVLA